MQLVPSEDLPTGIAGIETLFSDATSVSAAVAFVTASGVSQLEPILVQHPSVDVELVARGAPITDPDALIALRALGVAVSVVMGPQAPAFHPKLWLARGDAHLTVLAGSGT